MGMRVGGGWLGLGWGGQCRLAGVAGRLSRRPRRFAWPLLVLSTAGGGGGGRSGGTPASSDTQAGGVGGGQKLLPPPAPPSTVCARLLYARAPAACCRCGCLF